MISLYEKQFARLLKISVKIDCVELALAKGESLFIIHRREVFLPFAAALIAPIINCDSTSSDRASAKLRRFYRPAKTLCTFERFTGRLRNFSRLDEEGRV